MTPASTENVTGALWRILAPHLCAGLVVRDGVVVETAPILGWALGKRWADVRAWMVLERWHGEPCGEVRL